MVSQVGNSSLCDLGPYLTCLCICSFKVLVRNVSFCIIQVLYCLNLKEFLRTYIQRLLLGIIVLKFEQMIEIIFTLFFPLEKFLL